MKELIIAVGMILMAGVAASAVVDGWLYRGVKPADRTDPADWTDGWARRRMERSAWVRMAIPGLVRSGAIRFCR
jgi:hypothetical protein